MQKKTLDYPLYPGMWCFFGGQAESENLHKEMERELKEEIGMKPKLKFLFHQKINSKNGNSTFYVFSTKINDLSKIKIGEGAGLAFFSKKEIKGIKTNPETKIILNKYFKEF